MKTAFTALALFVSLVAQAPMAQPAAVAVKVDNFTFSPMHLTVAEGTKVTWTNADDVPHTIVAVDGAFKSQALDTDETFSYTFTKPGIYKYFCSVHPRMVGTVRVTASSAPSQSPNPQSPRHSRLRR